MSLKKQSGFTLIELLVVVLIIGILAAIALPQYEQAVMKARWATMLPIARALKDAHELFYMANGYYETDTSKLDIQHPCTGTDVLSCPGGFRVDNLGGGGVVTDPDEFFLKINYCPGSADWYSCEGASEVWKYKVYLDHSSRPGVRECIAYKEKAKKFCKTIQGL